MSIWKKRCKGVISVFLIIILVSNYALIGLLVDSARQRMARANAEMALDMATTSILSYYNQMLFDLYGLFATDNLSEDSITALLSDYTKKTLGMLDVSESEVTELTTAIVNAVPYFQNGEIDGILFDGYHYNITVKADSSAMTSLANTDAVESQIIDHMKYRAPKALLEGMNSFLSTIKSVLTLTDRISKTLDKINTTKEDKETLCGEADAMLTRIKDYNAHLLNFSQTSDPDTAGDKSSYDPRELVEHFDTRLNEISNAHPYDGDQADEAVVSALKADYDKEIDNLESSFNTISVRAEQLNQEATDVANDIDLLNEKFKAYIQKLQTKLNEDPDNENMKTLYLPEIELAKSTMGEVLKNSDLIIYGRQYSNSIRSTLDRRSALDNRHRSIGLSAINVVETRMGLDPDDNAYLSRALAERNPYYNVDASEMLSELREDFSNLYQCGVNFEEIQEPRIKTTDVSPSSVDKAEVDKESKTEGLRSLNAEHLKIDFEETSSPEWSGTVDDIENDSSSALLQAGLDLLNAVAAVLEGARDSLYVNEYIISYFPNYVQHYHAVDSPLAKDHSNSRLIDPDSYYEPFNASQAELEYVLVGDSNAAANVGRVSARLTAVRMVFNTAAIFTDSGKIQQANLIASAAGPFAPLVSVAVLLAWALAESVYDTMQLLQGNDMLIFKQGGDWNFSLEGGAKEISSGVLGMVGENVEGVMNEKLNTLSDTVKSVSNTIVYDAYQEIERGSQQALDKAQSELNQWGDSFKGAVKEPVSLDLSGAIRPVMNTAGDARDQVLLTINRGVDAASGKIKEKGQELIQNGVEKVSEATSQKLSGFLQVGNPEKTGSSDSPEWGKLKFNYLDYMRIFLMFMSREARVQRIQQLIQANIRYKQGNDDFSVSGSYVAVGATLEGSINFMFMSNAILPSQLKQNGRLRFTVNSCMSY